MARIDHIAFRVRDRNKTVQFLCDALGYHVQQEFPIYFNDEKTDFAMCTALEPPEKVTKRGIESTEKQKKPDHTYLYGEYLKYKPLMPINRPVRVVTKDGTIINGRRLNEDTYGLQIIDDHERLHSLVKADLREYTISRTSPMPSYKGTLSSEEIADMLAYLLSLKGQ